MPHRALQYGSHTWPSRPELTILQSSDTKASSAYSVNTQAELDPPAHLVTQFSPDEHVEWHFLKRDSQSTLRQRIERRDGHCVFSGWSAGWEAARLVRSFNSNWVSLAATDVVLWPDSHSQALAHITCTRAPLSHHSVAELNKIEGIYDPRVAAAMTSTLHKFYDTFLWAPATVGLAIRHSVVLNILAAGRRRRFSYYGSARPCWRRVSLHQMVLNWASIHWLRHRARRGHLQGYQVLQTPVRRWEPAHTKPSKQETTHHRASGWKTFRHLRRLWSGRSRASQLQYTQLGPTGQSIPAMPGICRKSREAGSTTRWYRTGMTGDLPP
jgi:hypothetical protein